MPFKTSLSTIEDDGVGGVAEDGWMGGGGSESGETESIASLSKMREELVAGRGKGEAGVEAHSLHRRQKGQAGAVGGDGERVRAAGRGGHAILHAQGRTLDSLPALCSLVYSLCLRSKHPKSFSYLWCIK